MKRNKMRNVFLVAVAALTLVTQNASAQDRSRTQNTTQTTTDSQGNFVEDNTSTTTTEEDHSRISRGGLFLEPMIFAGQEDQTVKTSQLPFVAGDSTTDTRSYGVGLRFGGHISEIFLLGLDARYARLSSDDSFYSRKDSNVYNIAPVVGLQTPLFGIRLLAGYVVAGENNPGEGAQGIDLKFKEAQGWRLGAGVHVGAVGINLEYSDLTYNKTEVESVGQFAANQDFDLDMESKGYGLSVSFPIEL